MKQRSLGALELKRKAFRRSVRDEYMERFETLPDEVKAEHEGRIASSHKEFIQNEQLRSVGPGRVGASKGEPTMLATVFAAVQSELLFEDPLPFMFKHLVGNADEELGDCGFAVETCESVDKIKDMTIGFVEGSSEVSGLGGSSICIESMTSSINSVFALFDHVSTMYEPATITEFSMDYDQATMDINTMYTYCAFDNYFASLGAFFGISPPPVHPEAVSASEQLQMIGDHLDTDVSFSGIQNMAKNIARIGGLLREEIWSSG